MITSVTLTAQEFSQIHNALHTIGSVQTQLKPAINAELLSNLNRGIEQIREALKGAYDQEEAAFEAQTDYYQRVADQHGFATVWSMYEAGTMMTNPHPYVGATEISYTVLYRHTQYEVRISIMGNRWLDLWRAADTAVRASGDSHHVFIENFEQQGSVLRLSTGS